MIDAVNTVNVNMYACIRRWSSDWLLCREVEFDVLFCFFKASSAILRHGVIDLAFTYFILVQVPNKNGHSILERRRHCTRKISRNTPLRDTLSKREQMKENNNNIIQLQQSKKCWVDPIATSWIWRHHGQWRDFSPGRYGLHVEPEGNPGQYDDEHGRDVHLDDVVPDVTLQQKVRPHTGETARWKHAQ